jgi:hypothetical protein
MAAMRPRDVDRTGAVWIYRLEIHKTTRHGKARIILGVLPKVEISPNRTHPTNCTNLTKSY